MKWYKHDPDAWLAGVMGLSPAERGAYQTVLCMLYSRDGVLADDDHLVSRSLGVQTRTWRMLKRGLIEKGKIRVTAEGRITANRVEKTLEDARKHSENQSKTSRIGAERRENANENNDPPQPSTTTTKPTSTTIKEKEDSAPSGAPKYAFDQDGFHLTPEAFGKWEKAFPNLSLRAELTAKAAWAAGERNPFVAMSNFLAKQNQKIADRRQAAREPQEFKWKSGIEGVV